jgi:hypothetical protein
LENLEELPNQEGWKVLTKHAEYSDNGYVDISWKEEVHTLFDKHKLNNRKN